MVRLWPGEDERSCCSPGALQRARQVAAAMGVPFHTLDLEADFARHVVAPFVDSYVAGETPNPCVTCNPRRLSALVDMATELGLEGIATGHYARRRWIDGEPYLTRAQDRTKDQTYMLWAVPTDVLAQLEFPLGDLAKPEVRDLAAEHRLPVADEPESQEACFAADGYREFLARRGVASRPGLIVDRDGTPLGTHGGQWRYTIGQRRGLGLSGPRPLYVLERRAASNEVVVGEREALDQRTIAIRVMSDRGLDLDDDLEVQLRYRSPAVPVLRLERTHGGHVLAHLATPFSGAAPGQSAVFYRGDVLIGGGVITTLSAAVQRV